MGNLIVDLMTENGLLDRENKHLNSEVKRLGDIIDKNNDTYIKKLYELDNVNKECAKENKKLKASVDYLTQVRDEQKLEIEHLKGNINDQIDYVLNDEVLELKAHIKKQNKLIEILRGKLNTQRKNSRKLQRDLEQEENENKNLSEQNRILIQSYNRIKNETEEIVLKETDIKNNHYKEINNLKESVERYKTIINDLKRSLNEKETIERDYNRDIEYLNKDLEIASNVIIKLNEEKLNAIEMTAQKERELTIYKNGVKLYESAERTYKHKIKQLKEVIEKKNKSIEHFMNKTKELQEELENEKGR